MNIFVKIAIFMALVIAINMVLSNIFHVEEIVIFAISISITVFLATYGYRRTCSPEDRKEDSRPPPPPPPA